MRMSPVSFGKVIAVSGKPGKMYQLGNRMNNRHQKRLLVKDVTNIYKNNPGGSMLADAANAGETVQLFITDEDVSKVLKKEKGWHNISVILSQMTDFFSLTDKSNSVKEVANIILDKEE